ncbi:hypothetical protein BDR03DRAFT_115957 [Suillus americanus]|nr:hypothetical protein BDR03DRAFT_115957 [Suillus americanus]
MTSGSLSIHSIDIMASPLIYMISCIMHHANQRQQRSTDDPSLWSFISYNSFINYFLAASSTMVVYDWALTFGQEFELILSQRWSLMTVLYICVRYIGILFSAINILSILPVSIPDVVRTVIWYIGTWTPVIVNGLLGVIMIARINAMYHGSKKLFIFLVVTLLACTITSGVMVVIENLGVSARGRPFRLPCLHYLHGHEHDESELREHDIHRCMGGPRLVSYSLDCYKTFP